MQIYVMLKRLITKGNYNKEDMINKLDTYYLVGRLTDSEYMELMEMVNPTEIIEPPIEETPEGTIDGAVTLPSFPDEDEITGPTSEDATTLPS